MKKKRVRRPSKKVSQTAQTITRLNALYKKAVALENVKDALAIQLAINGLASDTGDEAGELRAARSHLSPLNLAPPDTPVDELARLAVQRIVELNSGAGRSVDGESEIVRSHLIPLKLAPEGTPVGELARLAVQRIVELSSAHPDGKT